MVFVVLWSARQGVRRMNVRRAERSLFEEEIVRLG